MAIENFMMEFLERGKGSSHSVRASVWNAVYETFSYGELKTRVFQMVERMNGQEEDLAEDGSSEGAMPQMVVMIEQYLVDNYQRNIRAGELSMEFGFVSEYISRILRNTRASIPASAGNGWRMGQGRFKDRFRTG